MVLFRVYILRQAELAAERMYLTDKMRDQSQNAFASAARVSQLASKLQQNAAADHRSYQRFAWAIYFGVGLPYLFIDTWHEIMYVSSTCQCPDKCT